jgi:hypothetical protein
MPDNCFGAGFCGVTATTFDKHKKVRRDLSRRTLPLYNRQIQVLTVVAEFSVAVMRPPEFTQPS